MGEGGPETGARTAKVTVALGLARETAASASEPQATGPRPGGDWPGACRARALSGREFGKGWVVCGGREGLLSRCGLGPGDSEGAGRPAVGLGGVGAAELQVRTRKVGRAPRPGGGARPGISDGAGVTGSRRRRARTARAGPDRITGSRPGGEPERLGTSPGVDRFTGLVYAAPAVPVARRAGWTQCGFASQSLAVWPTRAGPGLGIGLGLGPGHAASPRQCARERR
jgi:hypothetical protein